jgi:hypothetical protein
MTNIDRVQAQNVADRSSQCSAVLSDISYTLQDDNFLQALCQNINVSAMRSKTSQKRKIEPEVLAKNCGIGLKAAKRTVEVMTQ